MKPALALLGIYLVVTFSLQAGGLLVSRIVDTIDPTLSLMTFLVLFMAMFWLAWPLAVRLTTYLIPETALERRVRLGGPGRP
jgi:hypothetical protein